MFILIAIGIILLILLLYTRLSMGRCSCPAYLGGKTALITGGTSGIGFETALALASRGCRIIIAAIDDCEKAKTEIIRRTGNTNIVVKQFNLGSLSSVRKLADNINKTEDRLDILINNAAAVCLGNSYTEDKIHVGMQVNHLGPFLLTNLLVGLLKKSAPSRIIFVASDASKLIFQRALIFPENVEATPFSEWVVYANAKLGNIVTSNQLAKKLEGTRVTVNSLYPGILRTPMFVGLIRDLAKYEFLFRVSVIFFHCFVKHFLKTAQEGAQTTIHLALSKELENVTGKYFRDCKICRMPYYANDSAYSRKVWKASEELVKLAPDEKL